MPIDTSDRVNFCDSLRFPPETLDGLGIIRPAGLEDFQRDLAFKRGVHREINSGEAAFAEFGVEGVAAQNLKRRFWHTFAVNGSLQKIVAGYRRETRLPADLHRCAQLQGTRPAIQYAAIRPDQIHRDA